MRAKHSSRDVPAPKSGLGGTEAGLPEPRLPTPRPQASILLLSPRDAVISLLRDCLTTVAESGLGLRTSHQLDTGLGLLSSGRIGVLFLDLGLAGSDDFTGLERCLETEPQLPVVLVADPADETRARQGLELGAVDYLLTTEISPRLLERILRHCLGRSPTLALRPVTDLDPLPEILPHPVVICRRSDGQVLYANAKVGPTFGLTSAQLLEHRMEEFLFEPGTLRFLEQALEDNGYVDDYETELRRHDKAEREVRLSAQALIFEGERAALIAINDLTLNRQAETSLRDLETSFRQFFEENLTGNFRASASGKLIACNRAFTEIFGLSSTREAQSWNLRSLHPSENAYAAFLDDLGERGRLDHYEVELKRLDGTRVEVIENVVGKFDDQGHLREIRGYLFDVTKHKRTERQLRQSQKMEAVGLLAGGIAHDFNDLLTTITGSSELLMQHVTEEHPGRRELEQISQAGKRAAALTGQLLAFSRKQVLQPEILNLNEVVSALTGMLRRLLGDDVELVTVLDSDLATVKADRGQLEQVIVNLLVNARDAMPAGGRVTLETRQVAFERSLQRQGVTMPPGSYVLLSVQDAGVGIDEESLARVFEPFFTTKEKGGGTGLGLSTVYGIVKQSNGYVFVDSTVGVGTTFEVYLSCREETEAEPLLNGLRPAKVEGHETILLVEDETSVRELASLTLQMKGYQVRVAENGEEALHICEQHQDEIDLIVTDVVMPQMSGRELVERARRLKPTVKVLLLSGYTDESIGRKGVTEADVAFMSKPFTPSSLAQKVRELLDEAEGPDAPG